MQVWRSINSLVAVILILTLVCGSSQAIAANDLDQKEEGSNVYLPLIGIDCPPSTHPYKVNPILFVPKNLTADPLYLPAIDQAMLAVSRWYGRELNCHSFNFISAAEVIGQHDLVYYCPKTISETQCIQIPGELGADPGDIYRVINDLNRQGYRINTGTILMIFWVGGYGYAAGSKWSPSSGYAAVGDWNLEGISGISDGVSLGQLCKQTHSHCARGHGTIAHELGHAFGLPHPTDDGTQPGDPDYWFETVMWAWWNFPTVGLIDSDANPEKSILLAHSFFQAP
jgi:hypothetical protein